MKILFVSASPLKKELSIGNTFLNLFDDTDDVEMASVCTRKGIPDKNISKCFCITEKMILKNFFKHTSVGMEIESLDFQSTNLDKKTVQIAKKYRLTVFFWIQDLIWKIGHWKSAELENFIKTFKPDIIFTVLSNSVYLNNLILHIKKISGKKLVLYAWDNNYSLKQFTLSPFRWIKHFIDRSSMRKVVNIADLFYVISKIQKKDYEKNFNKKCKVLTKGADFSDEKKPAFKEPSEVIKMVYAGNISKGRYEILSELAKATEKLNVDNKRFELDIYTLSQLTRKQQKCLSTDSVHLHSAVSYDKIREIQKNSDILIHAEAFSLKEKLAVHQSFSTKIVDYLETNRCIFAIGDDYCSSIQYFIENDCGAVATNKKEIETELKKLCENRQLLKHYADKAWESGKKNHNKTEIQSMVLNDIKSIIK